MKICAVIPAAGRGTRLGLDRPKLLAPIAGDQTIYSVLRDKLLAVADHVHVVLAPDGEPVFRDLYGGDLAGGRVSTSIQPAPVGMGDAIFRGFPVWSAAQSVLVIWGDQIFVSPATLAAVTALHQGASRTVVLPVVSLAAPYVEYVFSGDRLTLVRQSREGDRCTPGGFNDIGTFMLSVEGLYDGWQRYVAAAPRGEATGEVNFLPFLPFLSAQGWQFRTHIVEDAREARGINSPDDLAFFRDLYAS